MAFAGLAITTAACGSAPAGGTSDDVGTTDQAEAVFVGKPVHVMPTVDAARARTAARLGAITPDFPAGAQLTYNGGKVNSAAAYTAVFWGSYWANGGAATASHIDSYYAQVVTSADAQSVVEQYTTPTQTIGLATYKGRVDVATDPPATIDDTAIETQIQSWIDAGTIPAASDTDVYVLAFPPGVSVTMQGSASCSAFCGYHSAFGVTSGATARYVVLPDPGCGGTASCGFAGSVDDDNTIILSHENGEQVTDPDVGLAISTNNNAFLGWYDNANGEIGDICAGDPTGTLGGFAVQSLWSNADDGCLVTRTTSTTPDYTLTLAKSQSSVAPGGRARYWIDSAATGGFTGPIKLWVKGLPAGAKSSFSTALSGAGETILRVTTSSSTPAGSYTLTVKSSSGSLAHSVQLTLTVT
jgi:hypothetical protein